MELILSLVMFAIYFFKGDAEALIAVGLLWIAYEIFLTSPARNYKK